MGNSEQRQPGASPVIVTDGLGPSRNEPEIHRFSNITTKSTLRSGGEVECAFPQNLRFQSLDLLLLGQGVQATALQMAGGGRRVHDFTGGTILIVLCTISRIEGKTHCGQDSDIELKEPECISLKSMVHTQQATTPSTTSAGRVFTVSLKGGDTLAPSLVLHLFSKV